LTGHPPLPGAERRIFDGTGEMRPAVGVDGGYAGTWTVRAGWYANARRRPHGTCTDTVAVWCRGDRLYAMAAAATPTYATPSMSGDSADIELGVRAVVRLTQTGRAQRARDLATALQRTLDSEAPGSAASFVLGAFPVDGRHGTRDGASLAVLGTGAGAWCLVENGTTTTLIGPGRPGRRIIDHLDLVDGHIVCLGTSGLARPTAAEQFAPLWRRFPDDADFVRYLEAAARTADQDVAAVALWCGRSVVKYS
jgi:hypothetical protein